VAGPGTVGLERLGTPLIAIAVDDADPTKARDTIQRAMMEGAGVSRSATSLSTAAAELDALAAAGVPAGEVTNLLTVARAVVTAAWTRTESRGGHRRTDFPATDPALSLRFVL
jgi:L-aspartate oxidase